MITDAANVARRLADALAVGDGDAVLSLHAPDAVVWHNTDGVEQHPADTVAIMHRMRALVPNLAYTDVRISETEHGFVQQHRMIGTGPGGPLDIACCVVVMLNAEGLVSRIDEYLDSTALAPLRPPR